jgi:HEAT repeat protein
MNREVIIQERLQELSRLVGEGYARIASLREERTSEDISNFIQSVLANRSIDARVCSRALWLAASFPTPSLLAELVTTLRSRPDVAILAADALCRVKEPSTIPDLEVILLDGSLPPESRAGAARALGWLFDPHVKASLLHALQTPDQDPIVLQAALGALGMSQLYEQVNDAAGDICRFLNSDSPDVRATALTILGNIGATQALPQIAALLDDHAVTKVGRPLDEEAARVVHLLRKEDGVLDECLSACIAGDQGDWPRFRKIFRRLRKQGAAELFRRLQTAQFMSGKESRSLCFNYFGKQ